MEELAGRRVPGWFRVTGYVDVGRLLRVGRGPGEEKVQTEQGEQECCALKQFLDT